MSNIVKSRSKSRRRFLLPAIVIALAAVGATYWLVFHHAKPVVSTNSHQVIKQLPPQPATNNGEKKPTNSSQVNQGTSTDNNGVVTTPATTSPGQWTVSQSGAITVKTPTQNATIASGTDLNGTATVSQVQYTLIDNQVGVISQGMINVVHGVFSASISFHPYAGSGRLDVFSTEPDGRQINEVEIPVNF